MIIRAGTSSAFGRYAERLFETQVVVPLLEAKARDKLARLGARRSTATLEKLKLRSSRRH